MAEIDKEIQGEGTSQSPVEKPIGRAGVLAKWKKANPNAEEPSEEQLWDFAREGYDGLKEKHGKMMEGQKGLHEYVSKDPRFGAAIGMSFGEGEDKIPFMQSLGRLYGPDAFNDSEEFMKGITEYNQAQAQSKKEQEEAQKNFSESLERFEQFVADNGLSEEEKNNLYGGVMELAEGFLMGNIPAEIFDLIHKGMSYDKDIQEAADTGLVEGKNEKVRAELKKKTASVPIPDLGGGTGAGKNKVIPKREKGSYYDSMEEVK